MTKVSYDNINFQSSLKPLPNDLNLIDNFQNIQYKGISIPRVPINPNNSSNIEKLLYSPDHDSIQSISNDSSNGKDICIIINDKGKENDNIIILNENNQEISKVAKQGILKFKNASLISTNNSLIMCQDDSLLKKIDNLEPQPPQCFISIINESISKNSNIIYSNESNYKIFNFINDLILNNLYLISSDIYVNLKLFKKVRKNKLNEKRKIHRASADDNILRKIQVHFLSFIVNFSNDVINTITQDKNIPLFKNLDYQIKKVVNLRNVEIFKTKTVGEILQLKVSPKMKKNHENANKNTYNIILQKFPIFHEYFQKKYLTLFKEYYYNENKIFEFNGKIIQLSMRTKAFCDLIKKNYKYAERLKCVSVNYILNTYKRIKKPNFKTQKIK